MTKKNKKQALGRGLSALLDDPEREISSASDVNAGKVVGNIIDLEIDKIEVNPYQPRTYFNEDSIEELAKSISVLGIIQPVTVRKLARNQYQLVSGERRYRAAKSIGISALPAFVRIANDNEILEMALVENIQRKDLDPIEIALSFQRLVEDINLTQNQLSQRVGKKRSTIANYMRLLKLDPIIQTGIRDGFLTMGHGRALINIDETQKQLEIYEKLPIDEIAIVTGYKQFLVETVTRKTAERIKYNIVLVREFHENYCDKRPGNYPATKTMLNFGKIDIKNYKVKVKFLKGINNSFDYNVVEYKTPYKKFINWYDVENGQTTPYLYVVCKKTKGNSSEFYSRSELIGKDINFNNSEYKSRVIYDCDRTMEGFVRGLFFNPDIKFKNSEIKRRPPDKGTVGESNIKNVCNKLNLNGRF